MQVIDLNGASHLPKKNANHRLKNSCHLTINASRQPKKCKSSSKKCK